MAESQKQDTAISSTIRRIARHRMAAKWVLFIEALLPRLLWPVSVLLAFLAISWFGTFHHLPALATRLILAAFALGLLYSLKDLTSLHWPTNAEADQRLEKHNGLAHQAVSVLSDKPAINNPAANALWEAHRQRLAKEVRRLEAGSPTPGISKYDPYGLRILPVMAAFIAFGFSYSNQGGRLSDAFNPAEIASDKVELRTDAWITPPAYTGKPPIFLTNGNVAEEPLIIPDNSELTVRLSGGGYREGEVTFQTAEGAEPASLLPQEEVASDEREDQTPANLSHTYLLKLVSDGSLNVNGHSWQFSILHDQPPQIAFEKEPARAVSGALEITFSAKDDYGVQSAHALIEPVTAAEGATPLYQPPEYKLNLPERNSREVKNITSRNLSEHPLAGKHVRITLVATDNAGNEGRSKTLEIILPGRNFSQPLAAAAAEQRQTFALDTRELAWAIKLNQALFLRPEETIENLTHFLLLQSAQNRMRLADSEDKLKNTSDYLWEIALGIEDGNLSLAERRLREAQQALSDVLERDASNEEIQRLMQELREAMQEYMQALAEQLRNNPDARNMQQETANLLRQQDLERMLDQIENLAQSGAREQAMNMLNEMQRMLNNLQTTRPGNQRSPQNDAMRKQLDKLAEILQNQKSLMDQTFEMEQALRDRMQRGDPQEGDEQQGDSPYESMTAEELREALKNLREQQQRLGEQLGQLQEALRQQGLKPSPGFGEAGREMGEATEALGKGQGGKAVGDQGAAIEALRKGASELMQQLAEQGQGQQGQGQALSQPGQQGLDPLGRPLKTDGPDFSENTKLPDEIDAQRAREILETIRRKLGESLTPEIERQYLERLLGL